jgi:cobalamin synthase
MAVSIAIVLGANRGAVAAVAALCLTGVVGIFYQHWLSGVTGDMLGAASEVVEVSVLVLMVALMGHA